MKLSRSTATLFSVGIGSALIYLAALLRFPLLDIYYIPLQNLDRLTQSNPVTGFGISVAIGLLFGAYGLGARVLATRRMERAWLLVLFPLLFALLLLFVYPTTSLDVYDYLFRGRMAVRYGANNFVHVPADYAADPLLNSQPFRFIPWNRAVTAYGPLWEALSYAAAWFGGERHTGVPVAIDPYLRHLIIAYKALGLLGMFACGAVIWGALGVVTPRHRWLGLYLWLWNPLVLWESVAAGHNDAWMVLTVVAALWSFGRLGVRQGEGEKGRQASSLHLPASSLQPSAFLVPFIALTAGGLIKYLALIFAPLLLAASLRRLVGWRARVALIGWGALVCGVMVGVAYAPFWQGLATLRNFGDRGTLFYATWLAALQAGLTEAGWVSRGVSQQLVSVLATVLLLGGVLWSIWRGWRAPERATEHALGLLVWFLLVCNPWFQPWYLLWALALVAIQPHHSRVLVAVILLAFTAMLSYVAGSFLLPVLGWKSESAAWNALLALLIYLPPLVVLLGDWRLRFSRAKSPKVEYI